VKHKALNPSLLYKVLKGFLWGMFKPRTDFILFLFIECSMFQVNSFLFNNNPLRLNVFTIEQLFLPLMPESSPYVSYENCL
jgi:hypothetical protein